MYNNEFNIPYNLEIKGNNIDLELKVAEFKPIDWLKSCGILETVQQFPNEIIAEILKSDIIELIEIEQKQLNLKKSNQTSLIQKLRKKLLSQKLDLSNSVVISTIILQAKKDINNSNQSKN
jgi:hypothetical protein